MKDKKKKEQEENPKGSEVQDAPESTLGDFAGQCEEYKTKWLRAQADYQNLQKEVSAQRSEWAKMSEIQILEEFLPVYENFRIAFRHDVGEESSAWQNWKKGIEYIMKQYGDILESHGVQQMVTEGKMFDPSLHDAVSEEDSEGHEEGQIIREVGGGYMAGDRVLRAARVVVCKKEGNKEN
ncbi:MAG: nucleotide exchange factor GrpE [Candidatus Magasanikbacteria bacterium]